MDEVWPGAGPPPFTGVVPSPPAGGTDLGGCFKAGPGRIDYDVGIVEQQAAEIVHSYVYEICTEIDKVSELLQSLASGQWRIYRGTMAGSRPIYRGGPWPPSRNLRSRFAHKGDPYDFGGTLRFGGLAPPVVENWTLAPSRR